MAKSQFPPFRCRADEGLAAFAMACGIAWEKGEVKEVATPALRDSTAREDELLSRRGAPGGDRVVPPAPRDEAAPTDMFLSDSRCAVRELRGPSGSSK
jgi:hypothetical protein